MKGGTGLLSAALQNISFSPNSSFLLAAEYNCFRGYNGNVLPPTAVTSLISHPRSKVTAHQQSEIAQSRKFSVGTEDPTQRKKNHPDS